MFHIIITTPDNPGSVYAGYAGCRPDLDAAEQFAREVRPVCPADLGRALIVRAEHTDPGEAADIIRRRIGGRIFIDRLAGRIGYPIVGVICS